MNERLRPFGWIGAALLYAALVPWVLRPWFAGTDLLPHVPGAVGVMTDSDLLLNVWILAWIAWAAVNDPARLFDGNIFHPATNTIVGSENMLAHLPFTAAALAGTGDALFMLKTYAFECFVLSGLGMFFYVRHHTGRTSAALVAGAVYTFTPFRAQTLPQPQYLGIAFLPLALLFVDLWLASGRRRWLPALAAAVALQALACVYFGFFTIILVPVYALVRLWGHAEPFKRLAGLAAAGIGSGVLLLPMALPYLAGRDGGVIPTHAPELLRWFSWAPWQFASEGFVIRAGALPLVLVALDLGRRLVTRSPLSEDETAPARRGVWAILFGGVLLAAGPYLTLPGGTSVPLPYLALYELMPGFSSIRVPIRFALVVAAALAALGGFGFARLTAPATPLVRGAAAIAATVLAAILAAPRPAPVMSAELGDSAPAVYRWLAAQPGPGAVLEIPGQVTDDDVIGNFRNSRYMVASTLHWKPILNGYTAYPPAMAGLLAAGVRDLPDSEALQMLSDTVELRWVVVHHGDLTGREASRWPDDPVHLREVARFGTDVVYEVERASTPRLARRLREATRPATTTLEGLPIAPLPTTCRRATLLGWGPSERMPPIPRGIRVPVRFRNDGDCTWPALGRYPEGLVTLRYRWLAPDGSPGPIGAASRLRADLPPGEALETSVMVMPPTSEPGRWTLEVRLQQEPGPDSPPSPPILTARAPVIIVDMRSAQPGPDGIGTPL